MGSRIVGLRFPPLGSLSDLPACWGKRQMLCSPQYPTVHGAWTVAPGMVLFPSVLDQGTTPQEPPQPCPTLPWLGKAHRDGKGLHGRGCRAPQHPLGTPSQEQISKALAARGGGSAGLAGADREVMGLYTGSSLRCLLGCCWLLQENGAHSTGGTQAGGHRTRTNAAASTAQLEGLRSPRAGSRAVEQQ